MIIINWKPKTIIDQRLSRIIIYFFIFIFFLITLTLMVSGHLLLLLDRCCHRDQISYKAILKFFDCTFLFHSRVGPFGSEINSLMSSPYRFILIPSFPLLPSFASRHSIQSIHITCIDGHHKDNCNKKDDAKRKKIGCTLADGGLVGTASGEINLVNQCFGRGLQGF